ncbi:uncharacterized protein MAL13P1.304-like isoform X2 [Parasteatoda tepidariorum]|uniref:uncharacterized protein MAL13P1.304-like isoform X2 n=1 Tax=Parasteatoda tepidariorum TaxID=114398 RepID=UPI001C727A7E|nr:uncharacterized protein LOC122269489 isoform X2 [Parasteatoda tepidariorum]
MKSKESIKIFLFLSCFTSGHIIHEYGSDDIMDAFAEDTNICKNDLSDKVIFCRFLNGGKLQVFEINPCLCTHILLDFETSASDLKKFTYLRSLNHRLQILGTISVDVSNVTINPQNVAAWVLNNQFDGLDLLVKTEAASNDTKPNNVVYFIKEMNNLLKKSREGSPKALMLTLTGNTLFHLEKILSQDEFRDIDFLSILEMNETDSNSSRNSFLNLRRLMEERTLKEKILISLSIRRTLAAQYNGKDLHEICRLMDNNGFKQSSKEVGKGKELFDAIKNKTQTVIQEGYAGLDVWSLNDDDYLKFCEKKRFPILHLIRDVFKSEKPPFNTFKDLDIALSTGESQIVGEIQLLPEQNINSKPLERFKCDKIGFFRHPGDCTKFYHCSEYQAPKRNNSKEYAVFVYKCPRGLVYDELQGSCNWPTHSEPCQGSGELTPVAAKKFQCTKPGFHADSKDCRWFYYCLDLGDGTLTAFEFLCPSHLLGFDEEKLLCNWKWMVTACGSYTPMEGTANTNSTQISSSNSPKDEENTFKLSKALGFPHETSNGHPIPTQLTGTHGQRKPLIATEISTPFENKLKNNVAEVQITIPHKSGPEKISFQSDKSIDAEKLPFRHTNEKSYGRAVWHRSMINKDRQTADHSSKALDRLIEQIKNSRTTQKPKFDQNGDQRQGIGKVTKIEPKLHQPEIYQNRPQEITFNVRQQLAPFEPNQSNIPKFIPFVPGNLQGRSVGTYKENEIRNRINDASRHDTEKLNAQPYANVKCSKLLENNLDFGCIGEVSLVVNMKNGADTNKFIIKDDQLSRSAYQGTEQITQKIKNNNVSDSQKIDFASNHLLDNKAQKARPLYTQGRSVSSDNSGNIYPRALSLTQEADAKNNVNITNDSSNSAIDQNREAVLEDGDVLRINLSTPSTEKIESTTRLRNHIERETDDDNNKKSKETVMSINFYSQGVLLNVFLSHMNEIPPQTLIEVDNMLKKFMKDGHINIKLLEDKLNASTEGMPREMNVSKMSSVADMIDMLEKMINSTNKVDGISLSERDNETVTNVTQTSETRVNGNATEIITKVNEGFETSTVMNEYYIKIHEVNSTDRKTNQSTDLPNSNNSRRLSPILLQNNTQENKGYENNVPFVRRRLIRKFKLPSIKEQLDLQNKHRNADTESKPESDISSSHLRTTERAPTEITSVSPKRSRFPSIREQLENQRQENLASKILKQSDLNYDLKKNFYGGEIQSHVNKDIKYDDDQYQFGERIKVINYEGNDHLYPQDPSRVSAPVNSFNSQISPNINVNRREEHEQPFHNLFNNRTTQQQSYSKELPHNEINFYGINNSEERRLLLDHSQFYYKLPIQPIPYRSENPIWRSEIPNKEFSDKRDPSLEIVFNRNQNTAHEHDNNKQLNSDGFSLRHNSDDDYRRQTSDSNYRKQTSDDNYRRQTSDDNYRRQTSDDNYRRQTSDDNYRRQTSDDNYRRQTSDDNYRRQTSDDNYRRQTSDDNYGISNLDENGDGYRRQTSEDNYGRQIVGDNRAKQTSDDNYNINNYGDIKESFAVDDTRRRIFDETVRAQAFDHSHQEQTSYNPQRNHHFKEIQRQQSSNDAINNQAHNDFTRTYLNNYHSRRPTVDFRNGYITDTFERQIPKDNSRRITNTGIPESTQSNYDFPWGETPDAFNNQHSLQNSDVIHHTDNIHHTQSFNNYPRHTHPIVQEKRKKRRKLRILVKKRRNNDTDNERGRQPIDGQMKIPKHLLTELKSTLMKKLESEGKTDVELQIRFQDNVWNIPFVNDQRDQSMSPVICTRAGLFQHPKDCNMFYECFWDKWLNKFTLHVFSCPVKLVYDNSIRGCSRPSFESSCSNSIL